MILRMLGSDAEVEFPEGAPEAIAKLEARFPCPEWAVIYDEAEVTEDEAEADGELESDRIIVCRRFNGVLVQMAFIDLDEIAEMEADEFDWVEDLAADLAMTQEEIERVVEEEGLE